MRRAAKVDANQAEIAHALRNAGASVHLMHAVGDGFPDLAVGYRGSNYLLEIKVEGAVPSAYGTMTKPQVKWHTEWRGHAEIVHNAEEAFEACGIPYVLSVPMRGAIE